MGDAPPSHLDARLAELLRSLLTSHHPNCTTSSERAPYDAHLLVPSLASGVTLLRFLLAQRRAPLPATSTTGYWVLGNAEDNYPLRPAQTATTSRENTSRAVIANISENRSVHGLKQESFVHYQDAIRNLLETAEPDLRDRLLRSPSVYWRHLEVAGGNAGRFEAACCLLHDPQHSAELAADFLILGARQRRVTQSTTPAIRLYRLASIADLRSFHANRENPCCAAHGSNPSWYCTPAVIRHSIEDEEDCA